MQKPDEIRVQPPEPTREGGFSASVSFRRAAWVNFKHRKFKAASSLEALRLAYEFANKLPSVESWEIAALPDRRVRRQPAVPRPVRGGSVFFSKSAGRWLASIYLGLDERGNKILRILKCDSEAEARRRLAVFIEGHNKSLAS